MDDHTFEQVERMIREGKTIVQVCNALGLEWPDVAEYLHSVDKRSWRGAKVVITNRLKGLVKETDPEKREKLAAEADKWVDYLYYDGKRLGEQVERARRSIDSTRRSIDNARKALD